MRTLQVIQGIDSLLLLIRVKNLRCSLNALPVFVSDSETRSNFFGMGSKCRTNPYSKRLPILTNKSDEPRFSNTATIVIILAIKKSLPDAASKRSSIQIRLDGNPTGFFESTERKRERWNQNNLSASKAQLSCRAQRLCGLTPRGLPQG